MKLSLPSPTRYGYLIIGAVTCLTVLGLVMIYSVTGVRIITYHYKDLLFSLKSGAMRSSSMPVPDTMRYLRHQFVYLAGALLGGLVMTRIDLARLRPFVRILFIFMTMLLLAVFAFPAIKGAHRWIPAGFMNIQPTELLKPFLVFVSAHYLAKVEEGEYSGPRGYGSLGIMAVLSVILVLAQPDLGNTILVVFLMTAMLMVHGISFKYVGILGLISGPIVLWAFLGTWRFNKRILPYLFPERFLRAWDQPKRSLEALGSGGLSGMGLGSGPYKMGYLAEAHTDYIASMIGQELGFLGIMLILIAFGVILYASVRIALRWRQRDRFRFHMALGLGLLLTLQAIVNLSVVTYLIPSKGLTLPFVSYGGSSLLSSFLVAGALVGLDSSGHEKEYSVDNPIRSQTKPIQTHHQQVTQ